MINTTASTSLTINGLRLSVFLGVYPEELLKKQMISCNMRISFREPPRACLSDQLEDTHCYDKIISYLKETICPKKFRMIEHLTQELHQSLKDYFPPGLTTMISVQVTKQPAIADLTQGVTFEYSDHPIPQGAGAGS